MQVASVRAAERKLVKLLKKPNSNSTMYLVDRDELIVFSWVIEPADEHAGIQSEVHVAITPDDSGSELVIRHEKFGRNDAIERHAAGWRGAIDQLTNLLAKKEEQYGR